MVARAAISVRLSGARAVVMAGRFDSHVAIHTDTQDPTVRRVNGHQDRHHHHRPLAQFRLVRTTSIHRIDNRIITITDHNYRTVRLLCLSYAIPAKWFKPDFVRPHAEDRKRRPRVSGGQLWDVGANLRLRQGNGLVHGRVIQRLARLGRAAKGAHIDAIAVG